MTSFFTITDCDRQTMKTYDYTSFSIIIKSRTYHIKFETNATRMEYKNLSRKTKDELIHYHTRFNDKNDNNGFAHKRLYTIIFQNLNKKIDKNKSFSNGKIILLFFICY